MNRDGMTEQAPCVYQDPMKTRKWRRHMNDEEREASRILDMRRAGAEERQGVSAELVRWALRVLGDGIGLNRLGRSRA